MQYKNNTKIIIDKRKLEILLRLNCPKDVLYDAIINNEIKKTGDSLIDETLEVLIDIKEFENWGGCRKGSGRPKKNQLENQDENQLENQDNNQVVDKDIDKDKDIEIDNNARIDYYNNPIIEKVFEIYKSHCGNLISLDRFYKRNIDLRKLVGSYLEQTESDLEYFTRVCDIANGIKKIGDTNVDLKTILRNHDGFYNGKYLNSEGKNKKVRIY